MVYFNKYKKCVYMNTYKIYLVASGRINGIYHCKNKKLELVFNFKKETQ